MYILWVSLSWKYMDAILTYVCNSSACMYDVKVSFCYIVQCKNSSQNLWWFLAKYISSILSSKLVKHVFNLVDRNQSTATGFRTHNSFDNTTVKLSNASIIKLNYSLIEQKWKNTVFEEKVKAWTKSGLKFILINLILKLIAR